MCERHPYANLRQSGEQWAGQSWIEPHAEPDRDPGYADGAELQTNRLVLSMAVAAVVLAGCGGDQGSDDTDQDSGRGAGQAECTPQVRFKGSIYTGADYSSEPVTKVGIADEANCSDVGKDAIGSYFTDDPRQVDVWAFEGYPTSEVVGVRQGENLLGVFVSDNIEADRASQIVANLGQ